MFKNKYPLSHDADSKAPGDSSSSPPPVARAMAKARMKPDFTLFDVPRPHQSGATTGKKARPAQTLANSPDTSAVPDARPGLLRRTVRVLVKGLLIALLLVWIFILGVLVGRHNFFELPEVHQLADTIEDLAQQAVNMVMPSRTEPARTRNPATPPEGVKAEVPAPALSVEAEVMLEKGSPLIVSGASSMTGLDSVPAPESPDGFAQEMADEAPPVLQFGPTKEDTAAPKQAEEQGGLYSVRVLSTSSPTRATELVERLKTQGYDAYHTEVSGRYQIRVGQYATYDEARSVREKLEAKGYNGPYISRDNSDL